MAQNPIGTITDEDRLVALRTREGRFFVDVTDPIRMGDVPSGGTVAWRLREAGDVPRLAFAPVEDPDEAGTLYAREVTEADDALTVDVPEPLLAGGLGLDTEGYDDENPLLFMPKELSDGVAVGMTRAGEPRGSASVAIELVPVRYDDGTPFAEEPIDDSTLESDPIAEAVLADDPNEGQAPRSETISAPIDPAVLDSAIERTGAPRSEVVRALETIARHDLVDVADDETEYDPLAVDDRVVIVVTEETWTETIVPALDADDVVVSTVRDVHARQARALVERADADEDRLANRVPIVTYPEPP